MAVGGLFAAVTDGVLDSFGAAAGVGVETGGAPYDDDVAISVSDFAVDESTEVRSAFWVSFGSAVFVDELGPNGWPPLPVGIISTYCETADAGPSSAKALSGVAATAIATRQQATVPVST